MDYLERGIDSDRNNNNLPDNLQDTIRRGQNPISFVPSAKYTYIRFLSNIRSEEQEDKRKEILAGARGVLDTLSLLRGICVCQVLGGLPRHFILICRQKGMHGFGH